MKISSSNHWRKFFLFVLASALMVALISFSVFSVSPSGANVTQSSSSHASEDTPKSMEAYAGNVSEINVFGYSSTQAWQGYFGNVSGVIQLADSTNRAMYNWTVASPQGEIYASTNDTVYWQYLQCFNFTATGTMSILNDKSRPGQTSLNGTNLTALETRYGINSGDVDGINETFVYTGAQGHRQFYTNNIQFSQGVCMNTRLYTNAGSGEQGKFEEVLLFEPESSSVIFTSLLEQDRAGFDNAVHDFQMLVPENGHGSDTTTTRYYFYVELE
jgi:hypothetical protein